MAPQMRRLPMVAMPPPQWEVPDECSWYAIQVENVSKTFATVKAVDDLSFDLAHGEDIRPARP
jgi:hypothetical protein